jgi:hypothetical protein
MYSLAEKIVLPFLGGLIAPLCSWAAYRFALRRQAYKVKVIERKEQFRSKAYLFYRVLAGVLLGQFFCHTKVYVSVAVQQQQITLSLFLLYAAALISYVIMDLIECEARMYKYDQSGGPVDHAISDDAGVDYERQIDATIVAVSNVGSEEFSEFLWQTGEQNKDTRKRKWLLGTLMFILILIVSVNGCMLTLTQSNASVVCYYINGLALSLAVYGAMIHAKLHLMETRSVFWWTLVTCIWCIALILSTIPVLVDANAAIVASVISHWAYIVCYGAAAGLILKLHVYYYSKKLEDMSKWNMRMGELGFILAAAQSIVTGYWL